MRIVTTPRCRVKAGDRFGRLVAIGQPFYVRTGRQPSSAWVVCQCDCGIVSCKPNKGLLSGNIKSCGCYRYVAVVAIHTRHGQATRNRRSNLYGRWCAIKRRCTNPNVKEWPLYGGRGISVCNEWSKSYERFSEWATSNGYREDLEIDRIDSDGNYEPNNCRWVERQVNSANRRWAFLITAFGETKSFTEWARDSRCQVSAGTLWRRVKHDGWNCEDAISKSPVRLRRKRSRETINE